MTLKDWFDNKKKKSSLNADPKIADEDLYKLWTKCYNCNASIPTKDLEKNEMVCPNCNYHFRINARTRIKQIVDEGTFEEINSNIKPSYPLHFVDSISYSERQKAAQ